MMLINQIIITPSPWPAPFAFLIKKMQTHKRYILDAYCSYSDQRERNAKDKLCSQ